tara:strand:+ start:987 stop:1361 length:375 start_codon:yes stop_codon:yes gene_type:complete
MAVTCSDGDTNCRSFKIIGSGIGFKGGRYVAQNRHIAAQRAGSKLFQKIKKNANFSRFSKKTSIKFILAETTEGSNKKTVAYEVKKEKLPKPISFTKGDTDILVYFKYDVEKLMNQEDPEVQRM